MVYSDSYSHDQSSPPKQSTFKKLKRFFVRFLQYFKKFLNQKTLPHVANKACKVYFDKDNKVHQEKCRNILQTRLELNPEQLHRFFHTQVGDTLLSWFERFVHLPEQNERKEALKELLVQMAAESEGLSLLSFWRKYPDTMDINLEQLLFTLKRVELLLQETDLTIAKIQKLATAESKKNSSPDFANLPELANLGEFKVKQYSLELLEPKLESVSINNQVQKFEVICYQPQPWPQKDVPIIVQSHGLASSPEDLSIYANHLASHGYFVVAPQHLGSGVKQLRDMLAGKNSAVFKWSEFIQRPLNITYLLDHLEQKNSEDFEGKLNLNCVGIMGFSFGAYTAFALAGAEIHFEKLEMACRPVSKDPNVSLLLQCQALGLPRQVYQLKDKRIQGILCLDSVGSEVFGEQGIEKINIPVMLVTGSHDIAAPLIFEQTRLFQWLTTPANYLVLMQAKSHLRDFHHLISSLDVKLKISPPGKTNSNQISIFERYINALTIAFFDVHLQHNPAALPYLSANYADFLSESPFNVWLISQNSELRIGN